MTAHTPPAHLIDTYVRRATRWLMDRHAWTFDRAYAWSMQTADVAVSTGITPEVYACVHATTDRG